MEKIPFSLVTTCRNEMKSLPRWKQNVMDQTRQPDEIVIVDAFSDDGTYEYLSKWAKTDGRVKLIQEKGAAAHGRNIAIENTIYEHILSTDMGVRLAEVWCEELILLFESDESVEVVAGNTCLDIETIKTNVGWAEFYLENGGFENLKSGHVPGNRSIAYRKNVWKEVNSLPEDLTFYADDSVFGRQLVQGNYKFAFAPNAMTFWGRPQTLNQFFRENFVYGKGDGEAFIKTPRAFKWYHEGKLLKNMVPTCSFIINLLKKNVWKGFFRALSKGKWSVAFLIPILAAGRSYHHSKGYLVGFEKGNISCIECRARLKRDNNGYSIL